MFNKIILVGNISRDIELKYSQSGTAIANTSIATNRKFTVNNEKKEEVMFVDITFFGRLSEIANQYTRKGSKILVEGRLKLDQWVDKDGQKRSKHSVVVETMQMLDSKNNNQSNNSEANQAPQQGQYQQQPQNYKQQNQANQPPIHYENAQGRPVPAPQQQQMPQTPPEIDVDSDEIPF